MNTLYIVMPCYNEGLVIQETAKVVSEKIEQLIEIGVVNNLSKIVFVNDGSEDNTYEQIKELSSKNDKVVGINLSRNKGHQNALLAGLMYAKEYADIVVSMDADLQHDINAIEEFIEKSKQGADIIYGIRKSRNSEGVVKKVFSETYYKLMKVMGVELIPNSADYRLMNKKSLDALEEFEEANLFLRGVIPMLGFTSDIVYYYQLERYAGESKYSFKKMLSFGIDGITSFTIKPIRMITVLGIGIFGVSILMSIYFLIAYISGDTVSGWTSTVLSIWGIGGLQLLSIGIIGEYIGKTYIESKKRPRYLIDTIVYKGLEKE